jgi:hyperosmotically inducible protein
LKVPAAYHAGLVLMAERRNPRRVESKQARRGGGHFQPARGQDAKNMSMGEERHIAFRRDRPRNYGAGTLGHLLDGFPTRYTVPEQRPTWALAPDIGSRAALIRPVIPFDEIGFDLCDGAEAGEFARPAGTLQRAGENQAELVPAQNLSNLRRALFTCRRQGDVRSPRVGAGQAPCCLTMPDQPEFSCHLSILRVQRFTKRDGSSFIYTSARKNEQMKLKTLRNALFATALIAGVAGAKTAAPALTGDAAVAQKVAHEVRMYPYYSIWDDVNFQVDNGTVRLLGEVTQPNKKSDLGHIIARIPGVATVDNELKVAPLSPFDNQLRLQVARAIFRDPTLSRYGTQPLPPIHIIVDNGHVTLEGVVSTQMEKQIAGIRANTGLSFGTATNNLRVEQPAAGRN